MHTSRFCIHSISKIASACVGLYESEEDKQKILKQVEALQDYLNKEPGVLEFLSDYTVERESKIEIVELLRQSNFHEYLLNTIMILIENNLISYLSLYLSTFRSKLLKSLEIVNIYVYSCFDIHPGQKEKIERLWKERVGGKSCLFEYALDKSLKLGVKVQVGSYVEEFSALSNLLNVKLKLEEMLF